MSVQRAINGTDAAQTDAVAVNVAAYRENGYLVVPDALTAAEIEELRSEITHICRGNRGEIRGVTPADPGAADDDVLRRYLCIHFPHKISDVMLRYVQHPVMADVLTQLIGPNVKCMQSMLFIKSAGKPGQAWHQDEDFIPTRDRSLTGGWIALDDAIIENGCLWVIPGSHKRGILWPQREHDNRDFDCTVESFRFPYSDDDAIPVEVKAGSIVFFNGYLLHRSLPNRAKSGYRRVLVNHYMSAESLLPWRRLSSGERVAMADFRDIVMVTGEDPFAYKGTQDISRPHVRPSGEGGCAKAGDEVKTEGKQEEAQASM